MFFILIKKGNNGTGAQSAPAKLGLAAAAVRAAAKTLPTKEPLTRDDLAGLKQAHDDITGALADFNADIRARIEDDALAASISALLPVAALSESLREWFPVDPEMTPVRGTVLVPASMSGKKPEEPAAKKAEDEDLAVLVKRLLGHLSK